MAKYLRLARVTAWPASLFSFAVGFGTGATEWTTWEDTLFGLLSVLSFFSFAFALNFYSDRDVDKYHDGWQKDVKLSEQPLLAGEVTDRECRIFCILTFVLTIAFAWLVSGLIALLMFGACLVGGIFYSHPSIRFKAKPGADIACMSTLSTLLFLAGYVVALGRMPSWPMLVFFSIFSAIVYIPTVVSDYEYDARAGIRTSAVAFGQRNLLKSMGFLYVGTLPVAWLIVSGRYPIGAKTCIVIACIVLLVYTITAWRCLKPPHLVVPVLSKHSREVITSFGVIALLFFCWGIFRLYYHSYMPWDPFL